MFNRKSIFSIIVIILLIVAIILAVLNILNNKKNNNTIIPDLTDDVSADIKEPVLPEIQENNNKNNFIKTELSQEEKERGFLIKTASAFTERFGSYSNQSNYENLIDLKYFMSIKMQAWVDSKTASRDFNKQDNIYYGITTRALNSEIVSFNISTAIVKVKTQREEFWGADVNSKVSYSDILVSFIKESGVWKVDSAEWE